MPTHSKTVWHPHPQIRGNAAASAIGRYLCSLCTHQLSHPSLSLSLFDFHQQDDLVASLYFFHYGFEYDNIISKTFPHLHAWSPYKYQKEEHQMFNNSSKRSENTRILQIHPKVNIMSIKTLPVSKKDSGPIPQLCENSRQHSLQHVGPVKTFTLQF